MPRERGPSKSFVDIDDGDADKVDFIVSQALARFNVLKCLLTLEIKQIPIKCQ